MRVYNLTTDVVVYKGRQIPPNGESLEFGDLSFVPNRDLALENARVISFGRLPDWWSATKVKLPPTLPQVAVVIPPGGNNKNPDTLEKKLVITTDGVETDRSFKKK